MRMRQRTTREVLRDKGGLSTSIIETLGGISLKMIGTVMVGGLLVGLLGFWAMSTASASASSGFQASNLGFEKAVSSSDVVVGISGNRVGLLKDVTGDKCEVQTWQPGSNTGKVTLRVDTTTVAGVCTSSTPLIAAGKGSTTSEPLFDITQPVLTYTNLGGRQILFNDVGVATLASGTKPADVRSIDWDDTRPYQVELKLQSADKDTAKTTKKATLSAFTNVDNVTQATDDLRYVPSPSDDPIPGPLRIRDVSRSTTTGEVIGGVREGVSVTFTGAVCPTGPTKVNISYTQQSPTTAPARNTVVNAVLTGADTTVQFDGVANGSSGAIDAVATCVTDGIAERANTLYTQPIPATQLTVVQNPEENKHDLAWTAVSSLPTSFAVSWLFGAEDRGVIATTSDLTAQSTNSSGYNYGTTSTYTVVASVGEVTGPPASATISTAVPAPVATKITPASTGASWTVVTCPFGTKAEYASRYHQQVGTDTSVNWGAKSAWSTTRTLTGVTTPGYGRTTVEVDTRCLAHYSGVGSTTATSSAEFYQPEAVALTVDRSTAIGTVFKGGREGAQVSYTGGRCYNGTSSNVEVAWQPSMPTGQKKVTDIRALVLTASAQTADLGGVANGADGSMSVKATCSNVTSGSATKASAYTQPLPKPEPVVDQPSSIGQRVSWLAVSSLFTTYNVQWTSTNGLTGVEGGSDTTSLSYIARPVAGSVYGHTATYVVTPTVGNNTSEGSNSAFTPWPATSPATSLSWTANGVSAGTFNWTNGAACPAGTTKHSSSMLNLKWNTAAVGVWAEYKVSAFALNKTTDPSGTVNLQGYPFQYKVSSKCVSAWSESQFVDTQSPTFYNTWTTPAAPVYNAYTGWKKVEQPAGSIYDICRNHGTSSCSVSAYGNSIQLQYKTFCPTGSSLGSNNVHARSWAGSHFDLPMNSWDGWETGRVNQHVYYQAQYACKTPWGNQSPLSPATAEYAVLVRGW
ncbi:hypothetical protein SAMN06295974_3735 [Plantibacter flavus]|uniref:Uncharacterized protein n=2 Tax=Plantibacter flavus TaxID=150123 RepID=A0A3N2BLG9_9MICO|nr:hypothetical protein EDD42_4070 [Plantibacter flavus]SMG48432.1 hypothetical protein SAMN06295974_3735 [Plantibacter flavus]